MGHHSPFVTMADRIPVISPNLVISTTHCSTNAEKFLKMILWFFGNRFQQITPTVSLVAGDSYICGAIPGPKKNEYVTFTYDFDFAKVTRITSPKPEITNEVWEVELVDAKFRFAAIHNTRFSYCETLLFHSNGVFVTHNDPNKTTVTCSGSFPKSGVGYCQLSGCSVDDLLVYGELMLGIG